MAVRKHGTLVAATVATVELAGGRQAVEVISHGTDPIYFTIDGTTPTVQGDETFVAGAGGFNIVRDSDRTGTIEVKMISAGTPAYSVQVLDPEEWPD